MFNKVLPHKQRHSHKICSLNISNMKKLLGFQSYNIEKIHCIYQYALKIATHEECISRPSSEPSDVRSMQLKSPCCKASDCQSFSQWKSINMLNRINRLFSKNMFYKQIIYVMPIGPFPSCIHEFATKNSSTIFDVVADFLRSFFIGFEVIVLPEENVSRVNATCRKHSLTNKMQYLATDFFPYLRKMLAKDGYAIVGLCWEDLYPGENLNFLLGQGNYLSWSAIACFGRFDPNYVKGFKGNVNGIDASDLQDIEEITPNVLWKVIRIITHELCHVFGLSHCFVFNCIMNASSSTDEALSQPMVPCPLCLRKLEHFLKKSCTKSGIHFSIENMFMGIEKTLARHRILSKLDDTITISNEIRLFINFLNKSKIK